MLESTTVVIPAQAGTHTVNTLDWLRRCLRQSRLRENDNRELHTYDRTLVPQGI